MLLVYSDEIKRAEAQANALGIAENALMQRAGEALAEKVKAIAEDSQTITVLCGSGNNGGDGFVCAGALAADGYRVTILLACGLPATASAKGAFAQMPGTVSVLNAQENMTKAKEAVKNAGVIVDAVFGFGFHGELSGAARELVVCSNQAGAVKLAADIPSGAECDTAYAGETVFEADYTVTFTALKPAAVCYPAKKYHGKVSVADVGVPKALYRGSRSIFLTDDMYLLAHLQAPGTENHKGDNGKLLMVCGSYGMAGACILAAKAALRSGLGLLQIFIDSRIYPVVAASVPEAVFAVYDAEGDIEHMEQLLQTTLTGVTACLAGCGLGSARTRLTALVMKHCKVPLLLDADALNALSEEPILRERFTGPMVMTPHPGEMARLLQKPVDEIQQNRILSAKECAERYQAVTLLKGAGTVMTEAGGQTAVNCTGNPGMATGGSGDVLSGIIAAFMAQGYGDFEAAVMGTHVHGKAGDICAQNLSKRAMLPTDLIESLPEVYRPYE